MIKFEIYGVRCRQIVANCFRNVSGIKNGDSLLGTEVSGKGEPVPLSEG